MTEEEANALLLSKMTNAATIDGTEYPDLVEHVPGLITEGFGILAGAPKAGKSWLSLATALACALGAMILGGLPTKKRAVLLLALEDGERRLQARMRQLMPAGDLPDGLDIITDITPGTAAATITAWLDLHRDDANPPLVILDTLGRARPQRRPGDDPYIADYQFGAAVKKIVDQVPGAALLAIHHTRKQGDADWLSTVSGTQGIAGAADYILVLRRERNTDAGTLNVTGRDVPEAEYALTVTDGHWTLDGPDLDAAAESARQRAAQAKEHKASRLGDRMLSALAYVQSRRETTPKDLASYLKVDGPIAGNTLGRLFDKGLIVKAGRGVYAPIATTDESGESGETAGQATKPEESASDESGESGETEKPAPPAIKALSPLSSPTPLDVAQRHQAEERKSRIRRERHRSRGKFRTTQQTSEASA